MQIEGEIRVGFSKGAESTATHAPEFNSGDRGGLALRRTHISNYLIELPDRSTFLVVQNTVSNLLDNRRSPLTAIAIDLCTISISQNNQSFT